MKKLTWVVIGLLGTACAVNMATGCGSDNGVTIGETDGGGDGSDDGTTGANGDANGGMNVDSGGGNTTDSGGGNTDSGDGGYTGPINPFEGGVIPDASRAETGTCDPVIGDPCTKSSDCCTANCEIPDGGGAGQCANATTFCRAPGQFCVSGLDCCTGSCVGGTCSSLVCVQNSLACAANTDCCSGNCIPNATGGGGTCKQVVGPGGSPLNCQAINETCTNSTQCCSGDCQNGLCSAPSYCGQNGDVCATAANCCGGICTKTGTGILGVCGQPANAPGTPNCVIDGELCGGLYTGGALPSCGGTCCSKSCKPFAATGYLICQPASGCHPTGDICMTDAECCGGPGSAYASTTQVTCAGANPATGQPGRCANGNTCSPPGNVCKLAGMSCSTSDVCCGIKPNNQVGGLSDQQYPDICAQDNLGIPRCKTDQNVDCKLPDGGPLVIPAGTLCASSADCCGDPCEPDSMGVYKCQAVACVAAGGKCTSIADCCAGLPCTIQPGAASGICGGILLSDGGVTPPPDGGTTPPPDGGTTNDAGTGGADAGKCALYGQLCTTGADCCPINGQPIPCTNGRCLTP